MQINWHPSPNFNERKSSVSMIIIHYTGMKNPNLALDHMCNPQSEVSCHYFITRDGKIYQLVKEDKRSWHAGVSYWGGIKDINSCSIGIELENKGHEWGYEEFPKKQILVLIELIKSIKTRYDIPKFNILAHSDIAPMRKKDPGEKFPWHILMKEALIPYTDKKHFFNFIARNKKFSKQMISKLSLLGYDTDNVSFFSKKNRASLIAFKRRYCRFN